MHLPQLRGVQCIWICRYDCQIYELFKLNLAGKGVSSICRNQKAFNVLKCRYARRINEILKLYLTCAHRPLCFLSGHQEIQNIPQRRFLQICKFHKSIIQTALLCIPYQLYFTCQACPRRLPTAHLLKNVSHVISLTWLKRYSFLLLLSGLPDLIS
jgi:hypothetical protein